VRSAAYRLKVKDPVLSPPPGYYEFPPTVTLTAETAGALLRYSLDAYPDDGLAPVPSGTQVVVVPPHTLYVRADREGWESSYVAGSYSLGVPTPVIDPPGGHFTQPVLVRIASSTAGVILRYTTDGSDPDVSSPPIAPDGVLRVDRSMTLSVKGWRTDLGESETVRAEFRFSLPAPSLIAERPAGGEGPLYVAGASRVAGATVRCTTDGSAPHALSPICSSRPLPIAVTTTVKARAFAFGWDPSGVAVQTYEVAAGAVAPPALSLPSGTYPSARPITVACPTAGVMLHYTTNGHEPRSSDPTIPAGASLLLEHSMTLKVRAWRGAEASLTARADYILTGTVAASSHSDASGQSQTTYLALKTDGTLWGWGANDTGLIGDGTTSVSAIASPTPAGIDEVTQLAMSANHVLALRRDGSVWSWGTNSRGQLGTGAGAPDSISPGPIGLDRIAAVAASGDYSLALDLDGYLWEWGDTGGEDPAEFVPTRRSDVRCARVFARSAYEVVCVGTDGQGLLAHGIRQPFSVWAGHVGVVDASGLFTEGGTKGDVTGDAAGNVLASRRTSTLLLGPRAVPWHIDSRVWSVAGQATPAVTISPGFVVSAAGEVWQYDEYDRGPARVPGLQVFDDGWLLEDSDGDGLSNVEELDIGTDPYSADTNGDGLPDGISDAAGADPVSLDPDGDGVSSAVESRSGSDPWNVDTDGDGAPDNLDCFPLDGTSSTCPAPTPGDVTPPAIALIRPAGAVLVSTIP